MGNGPFSQQMELVGDNAVAEMVLRLDVGCAENFYGLNCNCFCTESRSVCEGSYIYFMVTLVLCLVNTCRIGNSTMWGELHCR